MVGTLLMSAGDWQMGVYHMWKKLRTLAVAMFAIAWWGVLYPELCFTEETFEQVVVAEDFQGMTREEVYESLLQASGDEIVIRSRFLEWYEENVAGKDIK
ncbi:hypothetical protein D7V83_10445 [bacterium 0.1xD8-71]|nr:hypothetical protein D7V83_10445 [bacterium 0.1xD8-71]